MSRSISTLVLLGISTLIVLFILSSFYKVFNREPIHGQSPTIETEQSDALVKRPTSSATSSDSTVSSESDEATTESDADSSFATTTDGDSESSSDSSESLEELVSSPEDLEETEIEEAEIEVVGTPGDVLHERPHLQNALPPIPQAPPSPQGAPVVTAPSEESYSQTGGGTQGSFPTPVIVSPPPAGGSSFPAPIAPVITPTPTPTPAPTPRAPTPSNTGGSSFPAPIINSGIGGTRSGSSSFPAPQ
ncbi:MAG: hypothetical protein Q4G44_06285 [Alcaligenaceae bacterium]|nr:hypothetical protein [Alcaligenaceae bacterium]